MAAQVRAFALVSVFGVGLLGLFIGLVMIWDARFERGRLFGYTVITLLSVVVIVLALVGV
jgi:hypothetical protein